MSQGKCFLCRCEDVTVEEFHAAYREGFTEFESLKRYTGVGTGFCQGKECLSEAALELAQLRGVTPPEIRLTTIRPPAEALTFAQLAALPLPALAKAKAAAKSRAEGDSGSDAAEDPE